MCHLLPKASRSNMPLIHQVNPNPNKEFPSPSSSPALLRRDQTSVARSGPHSNILIAAGTCQRNSNTVSTTRETKCLHTDRLRTASASRGEGKAERKIQSKKLSCRLHFYPLHKIFIIISSLKLYLQFIGTHVGLFHAISCF